jgi:hypothetical protein
MDKKHQQHLHFVQRHLHELQQVRLGNVSEELESERQALVVAFSRLSVVSGTPFLFEASLRPLKKRHSLWMQRLSSLLVENQDLDLSGMNLL